MIGEVDKWPMLSGADLDEWVTNGLDFAEWRAKYGPEGKAEGT